MPDDVITTREDGLVRDLVRRAYAADPESVDFDVQAGLDRLMAGAEAAERTATRTLVVRSTTHEYRFGAAEGTTVLFGRNTPDVHVELGVGDPMVSRVHGEIVHRGDGWYLRNRGRSPIQIGDRLVVSGQEWGPLPDGSTPMFVVGKGGWQHMLQLHVGARSNEPTAIAVDSVTAPPRAWRLTPTERQVLSVIGGRYLFGEPHPSPLPAGVAATELTALDPDHHWTPRQVSHVVAAVQSRLSRSGVPGLTRDEPVAGWLTHNLLIELLRTGTLTLADLESMEQNTA